MYAFGHIMFAIFLLFEFSKSVKVALILAPLSLLPDIDLLLPIKHRDVTHSIFVIPAFILIVYLSNKLFKLNLNKNEIIITSLLLYFSHLISDIISGNSEVTLIPELNPYFPKFSIQPIFSSSALIDAIYGLTFYLIFLFRYLSKYYENKANLPRR